MVSLMTVYGNPQYYVESVEELDDIPENAPASTIAIVNTEDEPLNQKNLKNFTKNY